MKKIIKKIILSIIYRLPFKNWIVLESAPDLSDNTEAVFNEMIRRGVNNKYRLFWFCYDRFEKRTRIKNVRYVYKRSFSRFLILNLSRMVVSCNRFVYSERPNAVNVYLGHGNPLKNTKGYYLIPEAYHYILATSEGMKKIRADFYNYDTEKIIPLGYPRNDVFSANPLDLHTFFKADFDKVIVWYPTVRQFKGGLTTGSSHALPIVWDKQKALQLNEIAKKERVLIVLKPHFAQNLDCIRSLDMSNIQFIDDSFFEKNKISSYRFVGSCDALLTDFSSIYYDYTLCDKPIGLIWEDYNEYQKNPGFAVDMNYMMKGGYKIYNLEDFSSFIGEVANNVDSLCNERRAIRDFANYSSDGKNSARVVDFLMSKLPLKS